MFLQEQDDDPFHRRSNMKEPSRDDPLDPEGSTRFHLTPDYSRGSHCHLGLMLVNLYSSCWGLIYCFNKLEELLPDGDNPTSLVLHGPFILESFPSVQ